MPFVSFVAFLLLSQRCPGATCSQLLDQVKLAVGHGTRRPFAFHGGLVRLQALIHPPPLCSLLPYSSPQRLQPNLGVEWFWNKARHHAELLGPLQLCNSGAHFKKATQKIEVNGSTMYSKTLQYKQYTMYSKTLYNDLQCTVITQYSTSKTHPSPSS